MKLWMKIMLLAVLALVATPARVLGQETDAEGCKDSPLISRFPGGAIHSCENKEYEQADFPISDSDTKHVEGEYHYWDYGTRGGVSEIQVFRNFQAALKAGGFSIDYASSPDKLVAHKGATWIFIDNRGTFYYQTIITVKDMQQEVTADASSLAGEIEKSGHVTRRRD